MGHLAFVTGPVRSGKSRFALALARSRGEAGVYLATYRADPEDAEMAERIRRHRAERPATWRTLEAPPVLHAALERLAPPSEVVLLDALGLWLADRLEQPDEALLAAWNRELDAFRAAPWATVVVGDEIGWSPVPPDPLLRRYRDLAGWLGQATAAAADEAWLCVAGCPLPLKPAGSRP